MPVLTRSQASANKNLTTSRNEVKNTDSRVTAKEAITTSAEEAVLEGVTIQDRKDRAEVDRYYLEKGTADGFITKNTRVIAIDFDDVIAQTNHTLNDWHNREYGTDVHISEWRSYYPYRNRGWGTNEATTRKLTLFFDELKGTAQTPPVATVATALKQLAAMGHPLHIVTSRPEQQSKCIESWLTAHGLEEVFTAKHFLGIYQGADKDVADERGNGVNSDVHKARDELQAAWAKNVAARGKLAVLQAIGAQLLIDDHIGHAEEAALGGMRSLLFGPYQWNRARWGMDTPEDRYTYEERKTYGYEKKRVPGEEVLHHGVDRALDWAAVVEWVKAWDREASASSPKES